MISHHVLESVMWESALSIINLCLTNVWEMHVALSHGKDHAQV
jgi:hypothetical protein